MPPGGVAMNNELGKALKDFRIKLLPEYSNETLLRASRRMTYFASFMDIYHLDEEEIYEYCDNQLSLGKMKKSLRLEMEDLARWCKYTNQKVDLPHFKKEAAAEPWFPTDEEYQRVLETCIKKQKELIRDAKKQDEHVRKWKRIELIIRMLGEGGMRVSELARINIQDLSERGVFIRSSKKEKNRNVALMPYTIDLIRDYIETYRYSSDKALLTGKTGRLTTAIIRKEVKESGHAAGIDKLHPHALRHYCATFLLKNGVDLRKIQIHMGHSDIQSTTMYTHMISSNVQEEIYELYSSVRMPGFFRYEEEVVYV